MSLRNFRLLFAGAATSLLGDQFTLIATPWLVLQLTNDPMTLGIVLALGRYPRALFMLLEGAITDHYSPRLVMLSASIIRFFLTAAMSALVFLGVIEVWMIYLFGLAFGIVAGFAIPAENSIVPMVVNKDDLQAGNSTIWAPLRWPDLWPYIAGGLMVSSPTQPGCRAGFTVDAFTFSISVLTLWFMSLEEVGGLPSM